MNISGQCGGNAIQSTEQHVFCAKNRRLVYNRTRRFSALAENRYRTVPGGAEGAGAAWELMFLPEDLSRSPLGRPGR